MDNQLDLMDKLPSGFKEADLPALEAYNAFMDHHYTTLNEQLRNDLVDDPKFGPLIELQTPEEQQAQNEYSRKLEREAILENKWKAYADHLLSQGVTYAHLGMTFSDWSRVVKLYRDMALPYIFNAYEKDLANLKNVLDGMNKMLDMALNIIAESYFIEKNALIAEEQKRKEEAQKELEKSESRFKALFENSTDHIFMVDQNIRIQYINHVAPELKKEDVVGANLLDFQTEEGRKIVEKAIKSVFKTGKPITYEHEVPMPGADSRFYTSSVAPVFEDSSVVSAAFISRDETNRMIAQKQIENLKVQLQKKVEQLNLALSIGKIGVWDWDLKDDLIYWDDTMFKVFGMDPADFHNRYQDFGNKIHPEDRKLVEEEIQRSIEQNKMFDIDFRVIHQDKSIHHITGRGKVTYNDEGVPVRMTGTNMDITDLKSKQVAIENITRAIYKSNLVSEFDLEGNILYANEAFLELVGYSREELIGKHHSLLVDKDYSQSAEYQGFWRKLSRGKFLKGEYQRYTKNGSRVWIQGNYNPIIDENGEPYKVLKIAYEITPIKEAEEQLRSFNEQLEIQVANRTAELKAINSELESFTYTVSHDLRAPIRAIDGFGNILNKKLEGRIDEKEVHFLRNILEGSAMMGKLIDDLLSFSRVGRIEKRLSVFSMEHLMQQIFRDLTQGKDTGRIDFTLDALPEVKADREMLRLAIGNIMGNALKYSSTRERSVIHVGFKKDKKHYEFSISDNGVGFEMEYQSKVFEIFQRLHSDEDFEGTGVGMAIVKRIIDRHGGKIWVTSELDIGTTFYFTLPNFK